MSSVLQSIEKLKVVPVVAIDDAATAPKLAAALSAGGLPIAEITFRTAAAADAIRAIVATSDLLVGAGTVLSVDQAKEAAAAGAKFIVSPGFNPKVVDYCLSAGLPITPGTATPTEIEMALDKGLKIVKFFPAESLGGLKMLKAIAAPYTMMRFMPTGGITPQNVAEYLAFKPILACGGSWMVSKELISGGQFEKITQLTQEAVQIAAKARK